MQQHNNSNNSNRNTSAVLLLLRRVRRNCWPTVHASQVLPNLGSKDVGPFRAGQTEKPNSPPFGSTSG
jgi:hypothetical protein